MMRAIETRYKGYRFRSRLEARWAVFFETAGVRWQYEPEGFETPSGRYLPDFFLPDVRGGLWVEVKGQKPSEEESEKLKHVVGFTGYQGIFVRDLPSQDHINFGPSWFPGSDDWSAWAICQPGADDNQGTGYYDNYHVFCVCPFTGTVGLEFDGRGHRVTKNCNPDAKPIDGFRYFGDADKGYSWDHPKLVKAYDAARSARFEHGEVPA